MAAGGIPVESKKWERNKDGDNGWSWTSVSGLTNYMTGKGYWDVSDFSSANAGNIIKWKNISHIGMITLNDTVTHRFSAHTNDVNDLAFGSKLEVTYYTIKTN